MEIDVVRRRGWRAGRLRSHLVKVMIDGVQAKYSVSGAPGQVSGVMQVNVQVPTGVQPGGYVPVVLQVGDASTTPGAVWIAVSN
jgi:uncharacterized protein (TIGR03437 family)